MKILKYIGICLLGIIWLPAFMLTAFIALIITGIHYVGEQLIEEIKNVEK